LVASLPHNNRRCWFAGIVGPEAVEVAGIVKMIQNCALGFIVVGCSVFWSSRGYDAKSQKPGLKYGAEALSLYDV
jgi:uncharacterized membrane protein YadS